MMHQLFFLARIYPYWALPLAFTCGQLALYFRRRRNKLQYPFWGVIGLLILSTMAWVGFRGDLHADTWIRWIYS